MEHENQGSAARGRALRVALIYLAAGFLWITFSDAMLAWWIDERELLPWFQAYKGWAFIAVTAVLLFLVLGRQFEADSARVERLSRQQTQIRELNQFRQSIIESAHVWITCLDSEGRVTLWNRAAEGISGYGRSEILGSDEAWSLLFPDGDDRDRIRRTFREIVEHGAEREDCETRIRTRDGAERFILWDSRRMFGADGGLVGAVAIGRDITVSKHAREALHRRERELASLMTSLPGMAYRCLDDECWTMKFVSGGCQRITGYPPDDLVDNHATTYASLLHPDDLQRVRDEIAAAMDDERPFATEYRIRKRSGELIWVWEQGRRVTMGDGGFLEGIVLDITRRKSLEQELQWLATRDQLTGLCNRGELDRLFVEEMNRARRMEQPLALLWMDLDYFKSINDRFGHQAGDDVLQAVGRRLANALRSFDHLARYGGEELVGVLPATGVEQAMEIADRLRRLVNADPFTIDGYGQVSLSISIGVAVLSEHGETPQELYLVADDAMYRAKRTGRNRVEQAADAGRGTGRS